VELQLTGLPFVEAIPFCNAPASAVFRAAAFALAFQGVMILPSMILRFNNGWT
jgi:hypothetical protein